MAWASLPLLVKRSKPWVSISRRPTGKTSLWWAVSSNRSSTVWWWSSSSLRWPQLVYWADNTQGFMDQVFSHKGHLILVWINLQLSCCLFFFHSLRFSFAWGVAWPRSYSPRRNPLKNLSERIVISRSFAQSKGQKRKPGSWGYQKIQKWRLEQMRSSLID